MGAEMSALWDARTREARAFFASEVLGPLVVATRPADLRTPSAIADAAPAWILCLKDVPADVLQRGVAALLSAGPKWMPRPGDLREACAADIAKIRKAAGARSAQVIAECEECQGSAWRETDRGYVRCECHAHALRLLEGVPAPLPLPPATVEAESAS
jgi:hypothetical protein